MFMSISPSNIQPTSVRSVPKVSFVPRWVCMFIRICDCIEPRMSMPVFMVLLKKLTAKFNPLSRSTFFGIRVQKTIICHVVSRGKSFKTSLLGLMSWLFWMIYNSSSPTENTAYNPTSSWQDSEWALQFLRKDNNDWKYHFLTLLAFWNILQASQNPAYFSAIYY